MKVLAVVIIYFFVISCSSSMHLSDSQDIVYVSISFFSPEEKTEITKCVRGALLVKRGLRLKLSAGDRLYSYSEDSNRLSIIKIEDGARCYLSAIGAGSLDDVWEDVEVDNQNYKKEYKKWLASLLLAIEK